jgi:uncharacterized iron-regulated protein
MDPRTGTHPPRTTVLEHAARARIVLLGEQHDALDDHRWQLDVLAGLAARHDVLVVGFEAFTRGDQAALDAWVAGGLPFDDLLARTRWKESWGVSPDLYAPLLHFTRRHGIRTLGLNAERAQVDRIRTTGRPPPAPGAVGFPAPPDPAYVDRLLVAYAEHGCRAPASVRDTPGFRRFLDVQLLWDRTMAETLAAAASRDDDALVVGLVGSGHLEDRHGVPHQLAALGWRDVVVLLPWDVAQPCATLRPGLADAVFGLTPLAADAPVPVRHRCETAPAQAPPPR